MKVIIEINEKDINPTHKDKFKSIPFSKMTPSHFNVSVSQMWDTVDEIWYVLEEGKFKTRIK